MRKQIKKNKIRHYRRLLNWTQSQLAKAVGSRQQYIANYEQSIHKIPECIKPKIASVLGLPEELIFPEDSDSPGRG